MISTGYTEISLHIPAPWNSGGGVLQTNSNSKCQDLPKFLWGGVLQTKWNLKMPRGGGGKGRRGGLLQTHPNSKCQDQPKFSFCVSVCVGVGAEGGGCGGTPEWHSWDTWVVHSRNFEHKFIPLELATASQIVSHILRCGD